MSTLLNFGYACDPGTHPDEPDIDPAGWENDDSSTVTDGDGDLDDGSSDSDGEDD